MVVVETNFSVQLSPKLNNFVRILCDSVGNFVILDIIFENLFIMLSDLVEFCKQF